MAQASKEMNPENRIIDINKAPMSYVRLKSTLIKSPNRKKCDFYIKLTLKANVHPIHLHLIFKNQVWTSFNLQKSISNLIFAGYTGSKNPVWNRLKIQFVELDFSNLIFQKSSTDQQGDSSLETEILNLLILTKQFVSSKWPKVR